MFEAAIELGKSQRGTPFSGASTLFGVNQYLS